MAFLDLAHLKRFKQKMDSSIDATYAKKNTALELTAKAEEWTEENTITIQAPGVTAANNIVVGMGSAIDEDQYKALASASLACTAQAVDSITITSYGKVPTIDVPISVIILG